MAKKNLERQVETWKTLSLILLLLLGIVGAFSYTLLFRQKERLDLQEMRIVRLASELNKLIEEKGNGEMLEK